MTRSIIMGFLLFFSVYGVHARVIKKKLLEIEVSDGALLQKAMGIGKTLFCESVSRRW